jgi:hypothetical protein
VSHQPHDKRGAGNGEHHLSLLAELGRHNAQDGQISTEDRGSNKNLSGRSVSREGLLERLFRPRYMEIDSVEHVRVLRESPGEISTAMLVIAVGQFIDLPQ